VSTSTDHLTLRHEITVAWGEQDAFGHLNNVVYFRYMESARMHFLERTGILGSHLDQGIGVILASTTCDFKKPVHWPAQLTVRTGCSHLGNTSFTMEYVINDAAGEVVASGTSVQVMYDYNNRHKVTIPDAIRDAITGFLRP